MGSRKPDCLLLQFSYYVSLVDLRRLDSHPGLGVWRHVRARSYALAFKVFQYNADGTSNGRAVVTAETEHNLDDTLTSTAVAKIYNASGDLIVSRCVNTVGTRFTGEN